MLNLLNEQDKTIKMKDEMIVQLQKENKKITGILTEQLETALTLPSIKEIYCNALLRILDEEDSVESAKESIKKFLGDADD